MLSRKSTLLLLRVISGGWGLASSRADCKYPFDYIYELFADRNFSEQILRRNS